MKKRITTKPKYAQTTATYSPRKTNSGVLEPMIFESKIGFSEGSISLDKVSEERQFLAGEGGSKSREFVLRGLYYAGTVLDLRKAPPSPDRILSATNSFSSLNVATATSPSDKTVFARDNSLWERAILRKSSVLLSSEVMS